MDKIVAHKDRVAPGASPGVAKGASPWVAPGASPGVARVTGGNHG